MSDNFDQGFPPMPKRCTRWLGGWDESADRRYCRGKIVVDKDGFHVCEKCGVSYGR